MAHFAKLDANNVVERVEVINNTELAVYSTVTTNGYIEEIQTLSELKGIEFCQSLYGADTNWRQTSYNNKFRGKYAAIGDVYDADADVFRDPNVVNSPDVPVIEPVVQVEQAVAVETQAPVELTADPLPALTSADISSLE